MTSAGALLWDFDGLVCDTERSAHRSWETLYGRHGLDFPDTVWAVMTGRASGEVHAIRDLSVRLGRDLTERERAERRADKARLANEEPLRPGVAALLERAARHGVPCAIVSSSPAAWVLGHLERLGVADRFALVVTGDQVEARKPAPDLYLRALELLGRPADTCLALEDSPLGVAAAKSAGLACVAVPNAMGTPAPLAAADLVLDSLEHLERLDIPVRTTKVTAA
ncbi:HAD family hydrolase [Streptomyces sp. NBC_00728]|uniref:HAD family hydrolase n=1 Tax=Streptomyces sp. NBC_00728 TaxID=2903676 RepID=UPI00386AA5BC